MVSGLMAPSRWTCSSTCKGAEGKEKKQTPINWRTLWTEEPGGLQSVWLPRVGHDWSDLERDVVFVSGGQQRDSAIHIHVSILSQTPLPSRLPHNIEQSSLCSTVGPSWLSTLNIEVYMPRKDGEVVTVREFGLQTPFYVWSVSYTLFLICQTP